LTPTSDPFLLRRISRHAASGGSSLPKSESHPRPTPKQTITTTHHYHYTVTIIIQDKIGPTEFSLREGLHHITSHFAAHMERRLYDIYQGFYTTDWPDQRHGAIPYRVSSIFALPLAFLRTEPGGHGGTKVLLVERHARLVSICFKYPYALSISVIWI
jgi:hypothetical protein